MVCVLMIMMSLPWGYGSGSSSSGVSREPKAVEKWFSKLPYAKKKVTKLHFYFHDVVSGINQSSVQVAQRNNTGTPSSPVTFGSVVVMDEALTIEPDPDTKIIGRAQGMYSSASQQGIGLLMAFNCVFTDGKYNGSTLSILSHNPLSEKYREMPILGGTGVFRLATGIATARTYFFNTTSANAVVEYHLVVLHY